MRLIDVVPLHVEQARERADKGPHFAAGLGDARELDASDGSYDVVLLMGPLYHLPERRERLRALREARRVARADGLVVVATISRFAGVLDGMRTAR